MAIDQQKYSFLLKIAKEFFNVDVIENIVEMKGGHINNTYLENEKIKDILSQFNFRNIMILDIIDIFDINKAYLFYDNNITIYFNNKRYSIKNISNNYVEINLQELIKENLIKEPVYVINNKDINILKKIKYYNIYNPKDYILDKITKKVTNM